MISLISSLLVITNLISIHVDHGFLINLSKNNRSDQETILLENNFDYLGIHPSFFDKNEVYRYSKASITGLKKQIEFIDIAKSEKKIFYVTSEKERYLALKRELDSIYPCKIYDENTNTYVANRVSCEFISNEYIENYKYQFEVIIDKGETYYLVGFYSANVKDIRRGEYFLDGNQYPTIEIGDKIWIARDLYLKIDDSWIKDNNEVLYKKNRLYTWKSANNACLKIGEGWRLPSEKDWKELAAIAGGYIYNFDDRVGDPALAYDKLSSYENKGVSFGPGMSGERGIHAGRIINRSNSYYWSSDTYKQSKDWHVMISFENHEIRFDARNMNSGLACRCVKTK